MNDTLEHQPSQEASSTTSAAPPPADRAAGAPAPDNPAAPPTSDPGTSVLVPGAPVAPPPSAPAASVPVPGNPTASAAASAAPADPVPAAPGAAASAPAAPVSTAQPPVGQAVTRGLPGGVPWPQRKSPAVAGLLSLMPGVGQIYVGYYKLGFVHNVVFGMIIAVLAANGGPLGSLMPTVALFLPFFVIYNIVDAVRRATLYNLALDGVDGIELPEMTTSLPKLTGSVRGGAALIAVGVVLLSNTLFGVSLDWLASWWPLGLVGLGVYLLVKANQERREADRPADGVS